MVTNNNNSNQRETREGGTTAANRGQQALTDAAAAVLCCTAGDLSGIRSVVLSISGCNSAADGLRMNGWLSSWLPNTWSTLPGSAVCSPASPTAPLVASYNDSIAALVSGTAGKLEGVVVIAGTGMICKGFRPASADSASVPTEWTAGGNGALIDSGSGYDMGLNVLRACFKAHDGMGPSTPLLQATLDFLGKQRSEQLVDWLYADLSWARLGTLAPLAFKFAVADEERAVDPVSLRIVQDAADYLVLSIRAVVQKLDFAASEQPVMIVCAGGLLQNAQLLNMVRQGVIQFLPRAQLVHPSVSPDEGAALLALAQWKDEMHKRKL